MPDHDGWDAAAAAFDDEADHGLRDLQVRAAWTALLASVLPPAPASVADIGCGTGTLSVLSAELGHRVRACDSSPAMLALAGRKAAAAGVSVAFQLADAATPPYRLASVDVVLVRHVLWALPDPESAVSRWVRILAPGGRLVLIEGRWNTNAGLSAAQCRAMVLRRRRHADVIRLTDPTLWGRATDDERYLIMSSS